MHRLLFIHFIFEGKMEEEKTHRCQMNGRTPTTTKFVFLLYEKLPKRHEANKKKT